MEFTWDKLTNIRQFAANFPWSSLAVPAVVLLILALLILPMPPLMLDIFFSINIILALIIIMVAINTASPLDFSSFPIVILFATTMRLGLNVASTRLVLLEGHQGGDAAGKVIEAFGQFVIGGNYAVGFIVFAILMIINFIVITKGAGRVSEVIARFTLDALPGKQMAIDADLNAGVIDQDTARDRRAQVSQESDFYGSMDGASKFVRGDAVAGLLILMINLVGGLAIGMLQHDLTFGEASRAYLLLTIGDGLVAQLPALILSLATALIVSRVSTSESAPQQATRQLGNPAAFAIAGGTLTILGVIPGMPNAVFLMLGIFSLTIAFMLKRNLSKIDKAVEASNVADDPTSPNELLELDWDDAGQVDVVSIELGYGLISLIDSEHNSSLLQRAKGIRKKMSSDLGFLLPTIRIRDNLDNPPTQYRIVLNGTSRGKGIIEIGRDLAINPGSVYEEIDGIATKDPAFGLDAVWIKTEDKEYAQALGYTVVDAASVIATHMNSILRSNADELMTFDIAQQLIDRIAENSPKLLEDFIPDQLSLSTLVKILQNLLAEGVPLKDMRTILETLSEGTSFSKDSEKLTALVRIKLGRLIIQEISEPDHPLEVMTLEPSLEQLLNDLISNAQSIEDVALEPNLSQSFFSSVSEIVEEMEKEEKYPILVVSPTIRSWLARLLKRAKQELSVLSYREIPDDQSIRIVQTIELNDKESAEE
ncbi:MAG TPA: flagellar biosynthesis protein FlhA [Gammaproteobacteria bacterium]|nr:flagellar biosynthesis protein FlhA [Gammaproteobacteria bacterium]HIK69371.1 flagellar biosynthesis protein FlhA [Pseudomonadales bacterium]